MQIILTCTSQRTDTVEECLEKELACHFPEVLETFFYLVVTMGPRMGALEIGGVIIRMNGPSGRIYYLC